MWRLWCCVQWVRKEGDNNVVDEDDHHDFRSTSWRPLCFKGRSVQYQAYVDVVDAFDDDDNDDDVDAQHESDYHSFFHWYHFITMITIKMLLIIMTFQC